MFGASGFLFSLFIIYCAFSHSKAEAKKELDERSKNFNLHLDE